LITFARASIAAAVRLKTWLFHALIATQRKARTLRVTIQPLMNWFRYSIRECKNGANIFGGAGPFLRGNLLLVARRLMCSALMLPNESNIVSF
jgi:hypothetical protein